MEPGTWGMALFQTSMSPDGTGPGGLNTTWPCTTDTTSADKNTACTEGGGVVEGAWQWAGPTNLVILTLFGEFDFRSGLKTPDTGLQSL